ncbi:hypothetical protein BKA67DRAFT_586479 [Truncatella angustata]|uniref:PrsW family intramembrane metalloprotease n=1 Tax=Truncatella angustata TaxID=152316 RepID=A0A9P8RIV0_9PEZI|nr:uncharacterized protein BKA67DRAFT_586479 [Truncatella angustata]KAH6644926.1 hypothetical protein BKA67DRAFT_586479 [Truncatella angustata]
MYAGNEALVANGAATMKSGSPQASSKATTALLWAVLPGLGLTFLFTSSLKAAFLPVLLAPTFCLFWVNQSFPVTKRADLKTLIWTYVLTGTIGTTLVVVFQSLLSYGFAVVIFGSDLDTYFKEFGKSEKILMEADEETLSRRREMAGRWGYWLYLVFLAFITAGLIEEYMKYCALNLARRYGRVTKQRDFLTVAVAAALGFSTIENIGFVYAAVREKQPTNELFLTVAERVVVGSTGHSLPALLVGINAVQENYHNQPTSLFVVIRDAVLFHGSADFMLFAISAIDGNVGWVHPRGSLMYLMFALVIIMQSTFGCYVRQKLKRSS